jgi:signal recognition particle subunit SRP54
MGMAGIPKELLNVQEGKMQVFKYIMDSMTDFELENPEKISSSRMERIATGSGTDPTDVRELLKQYKQIKTVVKGLKGKDLNKLAKRMGKGGLGGLPGGKLPKNFKMPGM